MEETVVLSDLFNEVLIFLPFIIALMTAPKLVRFFVGTLEYDEGSTSFLETVVEIVKGIKKWYLNWKDKHSRYRTVKGNLCAYVIKKRR